MSQCKEVFRKPGRPRRFLLDIDPLTHGEDDEPEDWFCLGEMTCPPVFWGFDYILNLALVSEMDVDAARDNERLREYHRQLEVMQSTPTDAFRWDPEMNRLLCSCIVVFGVDAKMIR